MTVRPFAGEFAEILFAFGLVNAAIKSILKVCLSTAYAYTKIFGFEGSLDVLFTKGRSFYTSFIIQLVIAAFIVFIPSISLFEMVFFTQSLNGILLPLVIYFIIRIANDKNFMGKLILWGNLPKVGFIFRL